MSGTSADVREDAAIVICVTIVAVHVTMEAAFGREYDGTGTKTKMITWRTRHLGVIITVVPIVSSAQGLNPVIRYGTMAASNPSSSSTSRSNVKFSHFQSFFLKVIVICYFAIVRFPLFCHCAILPLSVFTKSFASHFRYSHFAIERFQIVIFRQFSGGAFGEV